jgi:hypothetical protein
MLHDVVFSGITLQDSGKVGFSVSATVDRAFILYSSSLNAANTLPPAQEETGTSTPQ